VQYGKRIQAISIDLQHQQFLPLERIGDLFKDLFDLGISPGTCNNREKRIFYQLEPFEKALKIHLLASGILHFDETGFRCEKKLKWIHVTSSDSSTLYQMHAKRGKEALDEIGVIGNFSGIGIHDNWSPYFAYNGLKHGLCNAHHLREWIDVEEQEKEDWAGKMKELLLSIHDEVSKQSMVGSLSLERLAEIENSYQEIIEEGLNYYKNQPLLPSNRKGKQKQRVGKNLLDRLNDRKESILRFAYDFTVPFTNHQAERDIRMVKLRQKISGCCRTPEGGKMFCRIRSFLSTARKPTWNLIDAIADALNGIFKPLSNMKAKI
jgi:transposase